MNQVTLDMTETSGLFPNGRYYAHSGVIPKTSIPVALTFLIPVSVLLGTVYGLGSYWTGGLATGFTTVIAQIPIIDKIPYIGGIIALISYVLNFIPIILLIYAVILISGSICRSQNIRNPAVSIYLGLITVSLAHYIGWVWWIAATNPFDNPMPGAGLVEPFKDLLLRPQDLWSEIQEAAKRPIIINGFELYTWFNWIIWFLELVLLTGGVWFMGHDHMTDRPYCEKCHRWFTQENGSCWFETTLDHYSLRKAFEESQKEPLDVLAPAPPEAIQAFLEATGKYYRADLEYCPNCNQACTIDITEIWREPAEEAGKFEESETSIVENLWVTPDHFKQIRERLQLKKVNAESRSEEGIT